MYNEKKFVTMLVGIIATIVFFIIIIFIVDDIPSYQEQTQQSYVGAEKFAKSLGYQSAKINCTDRRCAIRLDNSDQIISLICYNSQCVIR